MNLALIFSVGLLCFTLGCFAGLKLGYLVAEWDREIGLRNAGEEDRLTIRDCMEDRER